MVLKEHEGAVLAVSFMSSQGIMITGETNKLYHVELIVHLIGAFAAALTLEFIDVKYDC